MNDDGSGNKRQRVDEFFLYEGGKIPRELRNKTTRVRFGPQIKYIPDETFMDCVNLAEVHFGEGIITWIGKRAFCACESLQEVTIPASVTKLDICAFKNCINLAEVKFNEGALDVIGSGAFRSCRALQQVSIPASVTKLNGGAFRDCINLAEVEFNGGALEDIGNSAFRSCRALQQFAIPSGVTKLGDNAFYGCINLERVHFNERLKIIGDFAFQNCKALRQVSPPASVIVLGYGAFAYCDNLAEVQLYDGLQIIEGGAFYDCMALRQVSIPSAVTELGERAFQGCTNLARVHFVEGSLQIIEECTFRECRALQSVTIPSSVTELDDWAFCDCNFTEATLLGGERLINREFLDRGISSGEFPLNHEQLNQNAFCNSSLATIKVSASRVLSQRMARLPQECRQSVEGMIRYLPRLELTQDDDVLVCFSVIHGASENDEFSVDIEDTDNQAAKSLHKVLQYISFHELRESSILIELAMWKSRLDEGQARADSRTTLPDPAKYLIMEYCGFTDFLKVC